MVFYFNMTIACIFSYLHNLIFVLLSLVLKHHIFITDDINKQCDIVCIVCLHLMMQCHVWSCVLWHISSEVDLCPSYQSLSLHFAHVPGYIYWVYVTVMHYFATRLDGASKWIFNLLSACPTSLCSHADYVQKTVLSTQSLQTTSTGWALVKDDWKHMKKYYF